ncbi:MAG: DUF1080 domain-containing protein [bacterium]
MRRLMFAGVVIVIVSFALFASVAEEAKKADNNWIQLFNGKDLTGWIPKIRGYAAGENFGNTFRVEGGVLKVVYDQYGGAFKDRFGHIFYKDPFTNYVLRVEYRFVGEQLPDGEGWAYRNNGIMIHGQTPESMQKDQSFPVSIEVQLLGGSGSGKRTTANLCTPGTHVVVNGKLYTPHILDSKSQTYHGDQWVTVEVEVRGNKITHRVEGQDVLSYTDPQLDKGDSDAKRLIAAGAPVMLTGGTISLQSESHPCEFRKIEIKKIDGP